MGLSLRKLGKFTHVRQVSLSDYSKNMARMSLDTRSRVVYLHKSGFKLKDIQLRLKEEDIKVSKKSLCLLLRKYRLHGVVSDLPKRAKRRKLALQHLKLIDEAIGHACIVYGEHVFIANLTTLVSVCVYLRV